VFSSCFQLESYVPDSSVFKLFNFKSDVLLDVNYFVMLISPDSTSYALVSSV
jgi:hypothetical protein